MRNEFDFEFLIDAISGVHEELASRAAKAVNISLTLRNWIVGAYIREYEQKGSDRAEYGEKLVEKLAERLKKTLDKSYSGRYLRLCRQFYDTYPEIRKSLISNFGELEFRKSLISTFPIKTGGSDSRIKELESIGLTLPGDMLIENLSFTHITELIKLDDPQKRTFYEIESIKGKWSVRELKRQIGSLYYERTGLSKDKKRLAEIANSGMQTDDPMLSIRDPYVFEFLGIRPKEVMGESDLEDSLLDSLQEFLLELGHGFCFEARQKRILIGDKYFFVDLVFYHRILKCHVLIELKVDNFKHEYLGQLNTYVNWYVKNEMEENDNPPVGILLCTGKNHALVEYALAGMDNQLFVSKYQMELPKKEEMERFLEDITTEEHYTI